MMMLVEHQRLVQINRGSLKGFHGQNKYYMFYYEHCFTKNWSSSRTEYLFCNNYSRKILFHEWFMQKRILLKWETISESWKDLLFGMCLFHTIEAVQRMLQKYRVYETLMLSKRYFWRQNRCDMVQNAKCKIEEYWSRFIVWRNIKRYALQKNALLLWNAHNVNIWHNLYSKFSARLRFSELGNTCPKVFKPKTFRFSNWERRPDMMVAKFTGFDFFGFIFMGLRNNYAVWFK